jgi:hypothetical protein
LQLRVRKNVVRSRVGRRNFIFDVLNVLHLRFAMTRRSPEMVDSAIVSDAIEESRELRARLIRGTTRDHSAPNFLKQVVRSFTAVRNALQIPVQRAFVPCIQRLERCQVSFAVTHHQSRVVASASRPADASVVGGSVERIDIRSRT